MGPVSSLVSSASWFSVLLSYGHCCANILKATALLQAGVSQTELVCTAVPQGITWTLLCEVTHQERLLGSLGRTTNREWWLPQMLISTEEQNQPQAWAWFWSWSRSCARALTGDGSQPQLCLHLWCSQTLKERRNCLLAFLSGKNENKKPPSLEGAFYSLCFLWNVFTFTWQHSCISSACQ